MSKRARITLDPDPATEDTGAPEASAADAQPTRQSRASRAPNDNGMPQSTSEAPPPSPGRPHARNQRAAATAEVSWRASGANAPPASKDSAPSDPAPRSLASRLASRMPGGNVGIALAGTAALLVVAVSVLWLKRRP